MRRAKLYSLYMKPELQFVYGEYREFVIVFAIYVFCSPHPPHAVPLPRWGRLNFQKMIQSFFGEGCGENLFL